jgi:hypothetical protein
MQEPEPPIILVIRQSISNLSSHWVGRIPIRQLKGSISACYSQRVNGIAQIKVGENDATCFKRGNLAQYFCRVFGAVCLRSGASWPKDLGNLYLND